jgi:hypothetical protein
VAVRFNPGTAPIALSTLMSQTTVPLGSAVSLSNATPLNVTSKALQAGTYLVWGVIDYALPVLSLLVTLLSDTLTITVAPTMLILTTAQTLYLVAQCTFSIGTVSAYGTLSTMQVNVP